MRVQNIKNKKKFNMSLKEDIDIKNMTVEDARKLVDSYKTYKPRYKRRFKK